MLSSPVTEANCWTPEKKCSMSKKLPSNSNVNGIVGNPAEPTVEPGGRPAAADCVAGTPVDGAGLVLEDDELDEDELDDDVLDEEGLELDDEGEPLEAEEIA